MPRSMNDEYIRYRCKRNCWTVFIVISIIAMIGESIAYIFDIGVLDTVPMSFQLLSYSGMLLIGIWMGARWQLNKCRNPEIADTSAEGWDKGWTKDDRIQFGIPILVVFIILILGGGILKIVCTGCPLN